MKKSYIFIFSLFLIGSIHPLKADIIELTYKELCPSVHKTLQDLVEANHREEAKQIIVQYLEPMLVQCMNTDWLNNQYLNEHILDANGDFPFSLHVGGHVINMNGGFHGGGHHTAQDFAQLHNWLKTTWRYFCDEVLYDRDYTWYREPELPGLLPELRDHIRHLHGLH